MSKEGPRVRKFFEREAVCCGEHPGEPLTKQSFKDECNVNVIMARFQRTGVPPRINHRTPAYGDFRSACEFQEALMRVRTAEESFAALPAAVRRRVDNDPAKFIDFVQDPVNRDELVQLGLLEEEPRPVGQVVEPVEKQKESGGKSPLETEKDQLAT